MLCFRIRLVTTLYFNGKKLKTKLEDTPKNRNKWHSGGQWFLGQDQVGLYQSYFIIKMIIYKLLYLKDTLGGSFEKQQSLSGILSNINIWCLVLCKLYMVILSHTS